MTTVYVRPIVTHYYHANKSLIKSNRAMHSNSAVLNCVNHMQLNHYDASVAEVFDETNGVLHAVVKRGWIRDGKIQILFKREVKENM